MANTIVLSNQDQDPVPCLSWSCILGFGLGQKTGQKSVNFLEKNPN